MTNGASNNIQEHGMSGSIEEFLLGIAEGVHKTQRHLSHVSIEAQPGQPAITYQLPRVEFEFKVAFELGGRSGISDRSRALKLRPATPTGSSSRQQSNADVFNVIKGSFVAVPAQGVTPPHLMRVDLEQHTADKRIITVELQSAADGTKLANIPIEFNIDWDLSQKLTGHDLAPNVARVEKNLMPTNPQGISQTVLQASLQQDVVEPFYIAVLIDALTETRTVTFQF